MSGAERRQWPRIPASLLSNVTASIIAGPDVKLVNLSRGGALMEVAARYPMRSKVRLKLTRPGGGVTQVHGTVSWAKVASISNGKINYLLAVIFDAAIEDLSAATGIEDIENHASVSMVADPFEGTEASAAALTMPTAVPSAEPVAIGPVATAPSAPEYIEEDLSAAIFTSRDASSVENSTAVDHEALAAATARAEELRGELEKVSAELAALSSANDNLSAQLQAYDEDRVRLRGELEAARQNWDEEKSNLTREAAERLTRLQELQASLEGHQQSGGQALAEQQALVQTLSTRLEALEGERGALKTELDSERRRWEEERNAAAREAAEAVARANALQDALERHNRESEMALAEVRALQAALESRLTPLEAERNALAAQIDSERSAWQQDRASLVSAIAEAQQKVSELEGTLQVQSGSRDEALARARTREQELISRLQAFDAERGELQARFDHERNAWQEERNTLATASAGAQGRIAELEGSLHAQHEAHERSLAEARAAHQDLQASIDAHEQERTGWTARGEAERQAWQDERNTLATAVAAAQARVGELEGSLHGQHEAHERALAEARATQQDLQARLEAFDTERQAWHHDRTQLESAVAAAQARVGELEGSLHGQHEAHERALAEARATQQELQVRLEAFDTERQAWHHNRTQLESAAAAAESRVHELSDALQRQEQARRQAADEASTLQQQLEARQARFEADLSDWQAGREAERAAWRDERTSLVQQADAAAARVEALEEELESRQDDHVRAVAEQQAAVLSLTARLEVADSERIQVQRELADERERWEAERSAIAAEMSARTEEFQAALEAREQIHADAIAREQARFEGLIAELMQAANDQQAEYQQLMAERTAALEEQVSRVERVHAELIRVRTEAELHRTTYEASARQLEARVHAAEAAAAAHEERQREACREAERLVALLSTPAPAAAIEDAPLFTAASSSQAVA